MSDRPDRPERPRDDRRPRDFERRGPRRDDDRRGGGAGGGGGGEFKPWQRRQDRPFRPRPQGDWQQRPGGGRPDRPPRPFADRPPRPYADRPPRPPPPDLAELRGPDEELIAGRHPVEEAFAARREAHRLIVVPERRSALEALVLHATTLRIPVVEVEGGTLTSLTGFDGHQGVALVVAARAAASVDDVLVRARQRGDSPFVLVLDSLEDPQNLGTLLRSAEACGVDGVVFPTRRSAPLSPAAIKASAGATEHLLLVPVDDLLGTLADLRGRGLRLIGADEGAAMRYGEADMRGPLALVVGSEGYGISGALRRRLDQLVRIPMRGRVASLNAAVAGSVLLFAAAEQRGVPESDGGSTPGSSDEPAEGVAGEPAEDVAAAPADPPGRARKRAIARPAKPADEPASAADELLPDS